MKHNRINKISASIEKHYIIWCLLVTILFTTLDMIFMFLTNGKLFYIDTDPYTRALRLIDLLNDFQFYEKIFPYSNYPFGDILHFTRINDFIWLALSSPFLLFLPIKEAVFYGGMLFSPLFLFLSTITIFWGLFPYIKKQPNFGISLFFAFIFTFIFLVKLTNMLSFSRPDHHSLLFFIYCFNISCLLHYKNDKRHKYLLFAGILSAIGLWASSAIEGLFYITPIIGILSFKWIFQRENISYLLQYTSGLFISIFISFLINPPYEGYFHLDNSRLSLIHVTIFFLIFLSFFIIRKLNPISAKNKFIFLCIATITSISILILIFGYNTLIIPVYHENINKYFIPYISEMQPLHHHFYFYIIAGLIFCFYLYPKFKKDFKPIYILFLINVIPTIMISRFSLYSLCLFLYLNIMFTIYIFGHEQQKYKIISFIYIVGTVFYLLSFHSQYKIEEIPNLKGVTLTDIFDGPRIIYEQNVYVVGTPYHTNIQAITDNHLMFFTTNEPELKTLLQKHNIEYIFLFKTRAKRYKSPTENTDKLYGKIITDTAIYPWLEKISKPEDDFYLYKVIK